MKLILNNFKCYQNATFECKDNGIFLLNGSSGIGKSTIFKAIAFVLYNKEQKVSGYNVKKKKTSVTFEFKGYKIVRTRCPNTLTFFTNEKEYKDVSAQRQIDDIFGSFFYLTGYIPQKNIDSFFSLSKDEKLSFLQKIALNLFDIDKLKLNLKTDLKIKKEEYFSLEKQISFYKKEYNLYEESIKNFILKENFEQDKINLENELLQNKQNVNEIKLKLDKLQNEYKKYSEINNELSFLKKRLDRIEIEFNNKKELLKAKENLMFEKKKSINNNSNIHLRNEFIKKLNIVSKDKVKFENELINLKLNFEYEIDIDKNTLYNLSNCKQLLTKYNCKTIKQIYEEYEKLVKKYNENEKKKKSLEVEIIEYERDIKLCKENLECPHCNNSVIYKDNKLYKSVESNKDINSYIKLLTNAKSELNIINNEIDIFLKKYKTYDKSSIENYDIFLEFDIKDINKCLEYIDKKNSIEIKLNKSISSESEYTNEIEDIKKTIDENVRDLVDIDSDIETVNSNIKLLEEYESIKKAYEEKSNIVNDLDIEEIESEMEKCKERLNLYIEEFNNNKETKEEYMKYENEYNKYKTYKRLVDECESLENKEKTSLECISKLEKCMSLVLKTESDSIKNVIDSINVHLNYYMSKFFDDNITMVLSSTNTSAEGDKKWIVDITILDSTGNEISIDSLSGGEYDRCALSLFLCFNMICKTPILMLDECLSSLHSDSVSDIVDTIREKMENKCVLMTLHQTVSGIFDDVMDVEKINKNSFNN